MLQETHKAAQQSVQRILGSLRLREAFFSLQVFPTSQTESQPAQNPLTPTVETVEKVPFQKLIFEKWDRNIEKCLVFCVPNNILAIFKPVVGDFCEGFSSKEFFDSLVGRLGHQYFDNHTQRNS